jgi:hypothetical protein
VNIRIENVAPFIQIRPTVAASNDRACSILILQSASPPVIRDKNRMH